MQLIDSSGDRARRVRAIAVAGVLSASLGLASCKDKPTAIVAGPMAKVNVLSGDVQSDTVGQRLPNALVIEVLDADDHPVPQQVVNFVVVKGGGSVFGGANSTNSSGVAQELFTLGTNTADSQVVEVRAVDNVTGAPRVFARFVALALADTVKTLVASGGNAQTGGLGATLTDSVALLAADKYGNPAPGKKIGFTVLAGGGSPSADSVTTGANGKAAVRWTLGLRIDTTHVLRTGLAGGLSTLVTATPTVPAGTTVSKVSGDAQSDTVTKVLTDSLVAKVALADGRAVQGATIAWSMTDGIATTGGFTATGANGRGAIRWTLGTKAGAQTAFAAVSGLDTAKFAGTALAGAPASLALVSGDSQKGIKSVALTDSLIARLLDAYGNGVAGKTVTWSATDGGGSLVSSSATTDAQGRTSALWTMGASVGSNASRLSVGGMQRDFNATAYLPMTQLAFACGLLEDGSAICNSTAEDGLTFTSLFNRSVGRTCGYVAGVLYCWRATNVGDGTSQSRTNPTPVMGGLTFTSIDVSGRRTCGIVAGGAAYCWGENAIGAGSSGSALQPTAVSGGLTFSALSGGSTFQCGLTTAGAAYCWGTNSAWELGIGSGGGQADSPIAVVGGHVFTAISAGTFNTCGLKSSGEVWCWGYHNEGAPALRSGSLVFTDIAGVLGGQCGLVASGDAYCWRSPSAPALVQGGLKFTKIAGPTDNFTSSGEKVGTACGLTASGLKYCWAAGSAPGVPVRQWP